MPLVAGNTIDASPHRIVASFGFIDINGQLRTDSYDVPLATTDAELNAFAVALGAASNASLWSVQKTQIFAIAPPSKGNAIDAVDDSIKDNIVLLYKNNANLAVDVFIPAPLETLLVSGTVNPNPGEPLLGAVVDAAQAIWDGFALVSYRYTERSKKNRAVKA